MTPEEGQAAIPEIASQGLTPAEQTRAKEHQDQEWERNLLESSGKGPPPTTHQQQRQRALDRQADSEATAARVSKDTTNPFEGPDNTTPDAADIAQAERRKRAAQHTSEGSYNEARYGSEESQGLIADESHP